MMAMTSAGVLPSSRRRCSHARQASRKTKRPYQEQVYVEPALPGFIEFQLNQMSDRLVCYVNWVTV
jgi:hypothetical protein